MPSKSIGLAAAVLAAGVVVMASASAGPVFGAARGGAHNGGAHGAEAGRPTVPATAAAAPAAAARTVVLAPGDTLAGVLASVRVARVDAHAAISSLSGLYDPRRLRPGQEITLAFAPAAAAAESEPPRFEGFVLDVDHAHRIRVARHGDGFRAAPEDKPLSRESVSAHGEIRSTLFEAAKRAGVPIAVVMRLIRVYSWDVDFQRDLHPGDRFEVVWDRLRDEDGTIVHHDTIRFAALTIDDRRLPIYRYTTAGEITDYFDAAGRGVRKPLMRTPIDGARLSSGYGQRKHPILGFTKLHKGVDFAAPPGTPIYAAGDGTVEVAARRGSYGRYVRIRHRGSYATAYAHLSGIARGVTKGAEVTQGEVIGYVGSSGRSSGPHLHYEILRDGQPVDPLTVRMPSGITLAGADLDRFHAARAGLDALADGMAIDTQVAAVAE